MMHISCLQTEENYAAIADIEIKVPSVEDANHS